tara:strand:+ start:418 stop:591 length:174 start_codon:yes stop_codon:yes gene_type:complete
MSTVRSREEKLKGIRTKREWAVRVIAELVEQLPFDRGKYAEYVKNLKNKYLWAYPSY